MTEMMAMIMGKRRKRGGEDIKTKILRKGDLLVKYNVQFPKMIRSAYQRTVIEDNLA